MSKFAIAVAAAAVLTGAAYAQAPTASAPATQAPAGGQPQVLSAMPQASESIASFYQHNVYDAANLDAKIGQIKDVLLDQNGKIGAFIIGVGDYIGVDRNNRNTTLASPFVDEKNVAVPFNAIQVVQRYGARWLTMTASKEALRNAPGYKYDKNTASWEPA